jgi:hypothetical protein
MKKLSVSVEFSAMYGNQACDPLEGYVAFGNDDEDDEEVMTIDFNLNDLVKQAIGHGGIEGCKRFADSLRVLADDIYAR